MERLGSLAEVFVEDVNKDDSIVLGFFDAVLDILFKTLLMAGVPFLLYVVIQFKGLL